MKTICDKACIEQLSIIKAQKAVIEELQTLDNHLIEKQIDNLKQVVDACLPYIGVITIICPMCANIQYVHIGNGHGVVKGHCGDCLKKYPGMLGPTKAGSFPPFLCPWEQPTGRDCSAP
jgi:hypothetical protein